MIVKPYFPELVLQSLRIVSAIMNGEPPLLSSIPWRLQLFGQRESIARMIAPSDTRSKN